MRFSCIAARHVLAFAAALLISQPVIAGPSSPHLLTELQPDNVTTVQLYLRGDEHHFYYQDGGGYAIVRDDDGWLVYWNGTDGTDALQDLVPPKVAQKKSDHRRIKVGCDDPAEFEIDPGQIPLPSTVSHAQETYEYRHDDMLKRQRLIRRKRRRRQRRRLATDNRYEEEEVRTTGRFTNLVILLRFAGSEQTKATLPTRQQISTLMNSPTPDANICPTGSVYSAYREYSYGQAEVVSSITPWIRIGRTERASANRSTFRRALWQALTVLHRRHLIDGRNFDAVTILHSGFGAEHGGKDCRTGALPEERIWAHSGMIRWNRKSIRYGVSSALWGFCGQDIARVGMIAHEIGHSLFRLPDLYDRGRGLGVGSFDLMAYAWGRSNDQYYPPHPSAWTKIKLGWVQPTMIKTSGRYTLHPYETNPEVFRIDAGFPSDEYLLVEFRNDVGFDKPFGCSGAVIYHIDDTAPRQSRPGFPRIMGPVSAQWPMNGDHYAIAVLQKDRSFHLEKGENTGECEDMWGVISGSDDALGAGNNVFSSYPNTDAYQNGQIRKTRLRLFEFNKSGMTLEFTVSSPYLGQSDRPTTGNEDDLLASTPGRQRVNANTKRNANCKDNSSYAYEGPSGDSHPCSDAKASPNLCRRKDNKKGEYVWNYCKSTCRDVFLNGRNPTDICPN